MKSSLTIGDLQKPIREHRQIIDVRSPPEFAVGHIPGAVNIPLDQLESRIADLDKHSSIVLVCQMGLGPHVRWTERSLSDGRVSHAHAMEQEQPLRPGRG